MVQFFSITNVVLKSLNRINPLNLELALKKLELILFNLLSCEKLPLFFLLTPRLLKFEFNSKLSYCDDSASIESNTNFLLS